MKQTTALVGPRGWAALVLAGGAAFAVPFLRSSPSTPTASIADGASQPDYSPTAWPSATTTPLNDSAQPSPLDNEDWQELSRLQTNSALPRPESGKLPSTSTDQFAVKLPSWAAQNRRVDQVVDGIKPIAPLEAKPTAVPDIEPQRAWINTPENFVGSGATDSLDRSLANTLSNGTANDPSDPHGRWTTATTPAQPNYASNHAVKPFEDRPKLWPDQKVQLSELAVATRPGISAIVQAPAAHQPHRPGSQLAQPQQDVFRPVTQPGSAVDAQFASRAEAVQPQFNPTTNIQSPSAMFHSAQSQSAQSHSAQSNSAQSNSAELSSAQPRIPPPTEITQPQTANTLDEYAAGAFGVGQQHAPRVDLSSASRRASIGGSAGPTPNPPPTFNAPPALSKPQAAPERPRHFIFQPSKKA